MRLLLCSYHFHPSLGGLEIASQTIADELAARGHAVTVVTATAADDGRAFAYPVVRRPGARQLFRLVRAAEVVWHNHLSLRYGWPLLLLDRPWAITHQTWLSGSPGPLGLARALRRRALRRSTQVAISGAVAARLPVPATVIPNPYRDGLFTTLPAAEVAREFELGFAGRLVSDKGCDLLLEALAALPGQPRLLVLGSGPEEPALRAQAQRLGLAGRVVFAGVHREAALARQLNRVQILVVPSRWPEPFGIVALEGLACGCTLVVSDGGGLPEAVGAAGLNFPSGDGTALRDRLAALLAQPQLAASLRAAAPAQLERHRAAAVADRYEALFAGLLEAPL
ncbi:MAG: glycosyltransferase family 4 protein [Tistlia sp.]|uniref:glycosyltransferase family 4 protein n=1 Tax=Tistlia sp. TaxID=3057121 RepID=UPI0034A240C6